MIQIDEMANVAEDAFTDRVTLFGDINALFFFFFEKDCELEKRNDNMKKTA